MFGHLYAIEFLGGPIDGHKLVDVAEPDDLQEIIMLPISAGFLSQLAGTGGAVQGPVTSVAAYARDFSLGVWQYVFVGSLSADLALVPQRQA